ncbi:MAG: DMT family transporter [Burkholderiales bacterium]|nr:DMT family transporter [Burkholderiales bacterium]
MNAIALPADLARHRRAVVMMIVAAICWSTGGLLVRKLSITSAWEIVFWRSLFMAAFVALVLAVMHGRGMPRAVRGAGMPGLVAGVLLAGTFFFFIASLTRTTVANTFVLMSVSPFLAALAARVVLKEPVAARTWIAMAIAFAGILVMFGGAVDAGQLAGNLLALGVSVCFAAQLTVLRKFHATVDMLPMVMIAGLVSVVPAFALAGPFAATGHDLAILAVMGCAQLGVGCLLATAASRTLSATELGLLALLEPILGPLWVWLLLGEHPGTLALVGGALVLSAVVANQLLAAWRGRPAEAAEPLPGP